MKVNLKKYKTKLEPKKKMHGWMGMNTKAEEQEKKLGVPKVKKGEVLVSKDLPKSTRKRVERHEKVEAEVMDKTGRKYKAAHKIATKMERLPIKKVEQKLKKLKKVK